MSALAEIKQALSSRADSNRAAASAGYFKTAKGEYGAGDKFLGVTVPEQRAVARQFRTLAKRDLSALLRSSVHEHRLTALLILVDQYQRATVKERKAIVELYLKHRDRVNNWDLVDLSAPNLLGSYLSDRSRSRLYRLARSKSLWDRRIAVLATLAFIKHGDFSDTLALCELLLDDDQDLIHKATGWMLREVGNRSPATLRSFLDRHHGKMPRTMLRYAIEKLDARSRTRYLKRSSTPPR